MKFREYQKRHPGFIAEVGAAKSNMLHLLHALSAARSRDRKRLALRRFLLGDPQTRLYFAFRGVLRARRLGEYEPEAIRQMSRELNVYAPLHEPVDTRVIRRGTRDRRIFSFRPRSRARQLLVAAAIKAIHGPFPNQHTLTGGVPAALEAVEQAVLSGRHYGRELDIRDFYPSVQLERFVTALHPLPRAVVENTVWMGHAVPLVNLGGSLRGVDEGGLLPARGLRGLPQGSACSPSAAEKLVADVIVSLPAGITVTTYADNIMLQGATEHEVEEATTVLTTELEAYSAGSLALKVPPPPICDIRDKSLPFLGQEGDLLQTADESLSMNWEPDYFARERIYSVVEDRDAGQSALRKNIRRVENWHRAYPKWAERETWTLTVLIQLKAKLAYRSGRIEMSRLATDIAWHWKELGSSSYRIELFPEPPERHATKLGALVELVYRRIEAFWPSDARFDPTITGPLARATHRS